MPVSTQVRKAGSLLAGHWIREDSKAAWSEVISVRLIDDRVHVRVFEGGRIRGRILTASSPVEVRQVM